MNDANQRLSRKLLAEIRLLVIHNKPAIPAMLNKRQVVTIYHACPNDQNVSGSGLPIWMMAYVLLALSVRHSMMPVPASELLILS